MNVHKIGFSGVRKAASIAFIGLGVLFANASVNAGLVEDKRIQVSSSVPEKTDKLKVIFDPVKASHRTGEPIRFQMKSNKDVYLYVFNVDQETGESYLLLPNRIQKDNFYSANQWSKIPKRSVKFWSDRAGYEKVVMIASTKKISLNTASYKAAGDFFEAKTEKLFQDFSQKGIEIEYHADRPVQEARNTAEVNVQTLNLRVVGDSISTLLMPEDKPKKESPVAFISTDQDTYITDEKVNIVYGANKAGWIHLYSIETNGSIERLAKEKVNGKSIYQKSFFAGAPYGEHKLVAVYSKDKSFNEKSFKSNYANQNKGLSLSPSEKKFVFDVTRIWIER